MKIKKVHLVGIGGIGMSGLARYFRSKGWSVSGSDAVKGLTTEALKHEGIKITIGHSKEGLGRNTGLVIYNRAIPFDNPELIAAKRLNILTVPYAKVLGGVTDEYKTIAITGSHGKSTTTALTALTLIKGGLDPTVLIGTNLKEFGGKNLRIGKGPYLVLEADDFGGAFLEYSPTYAIVTNIDREHLDHYKNFGNLKNAFVKFMERVRPTGALILNRDDKNLSDLAPRIAKLAKQNKLKVIWYSTRDPGMKKIKATLKIPGVHNLSNAAAVHALAKLLAIPEKKTLAALGSYRGAWRRMEYRGKLRGAPIFDDYAHHPTEIKATLQAFREKYPKKVLVCIFQPHQAKRLRMLFKEFTTAFDAADQVILLPLYKVAGRDEQPERFDALALAKAIWKTRPHEFLGYLAEPKHIRDTVLELPGTLSSKAIVMMGAGDIVDYTASLLS